MAVPVNHKGSGVGNSQSHKLVGDWELNGVGLINRKVVRKSWEGKKSCAKHTSKQSKTGGQINIKLFASCGLRAGIVSTI